MAPVECTITKSFLIKNKYSYTYFQVFFLVVAFGLFHGLVLLPTVLSICGPAPVAAASNRLPRKGGTVSPVDFEVGRPQQSGGGEAASRNDVTSE